MTTHRTNDPPAGRDGGGGVITYNARLGVWLFFVYLALYGSFVGLAAFAPGVMGRPAVAGVNLAVVYGFGLIVAAFVLALVYMALCRSSDGPAAAGASPEAPDAGGAGDVNGEGGR